MGSRPSSRLCACKPDARVDDRVADVRREVENDDGGGQKEREPERYRIIAGEDTGDQQLSEAGPAEDDLDDRRVADKRAQLDSRKGNDRDESVSQHASPDDRARSQA